MEQRGGRVGRKGPRGVTAARHFDSCSGGFYRTCQFVKEDKKKPNALINEHNEAM